MTRLPRNVARSLTVAVLCAAVAAAQTAPTAGQIAKGVTPNGLKADVSFLASDALQGRGTPSPGLDIAAEYIAAQFRRAGLEPAGDDGYFQTAPYVSAEPGAEGMDLTLEIAGIRYTIDRDFMSLLLPAPARFDRAPALRVTSPDAMAALTPDQKRGKVLVVQGGLPMNFAAGDPALIVLVASADARMARSMFSLRPASDPAPRLPLVLVWDPAISKALKSSKDAPILVSARIAEPVAVPVKLRNVVGVLRGSDPTLKDTYVLLTAHYDHLGVRGSGEGDHIYNGANDDASGTASIIEVANALGSFGARPKRSIVFVALFGEELGLRGSRYYAKHPVFPLARTIADLNVEQVGRTDVDDGSHPGQLNATGFDFTNLTPVLQQAGQESGIRVVNDKKNSDVFFARSDNQAFADAGIPSHTLSVGYTFPDYHRPSDEWPKLDYDNMARVVRTIALSVYRIADNPEAPRWNTSNPKTARYVHAREAGPEGARTQ